MALLLLRILIVLVPLVLLFLFFRKRRRSGKTVPPDIVPIALGILGTVILLIFAIKLTEPTEIPPRAVPLTPPGTEAGE